MQLSSVIGGNLPPTNLPIHAETMQSIPELDLPWVPVTVCRFVDSLDDMTSGARFTMLPIVCHVGQNEGIAGQRR
jgi:hypothetical protein